MTRIFGAMHDRSDEVYAGAVRGLRLEQKLRVSEELRALAWLMRCNAVRREHPEWSDPAVEQQVRESFLRAGA